jgi:exosortase/archaeosortase family protein
MYNGLMAPGRFYSPFLAVHLNYIDGLRLLLIGCAVKILGWLGFIAIHNTDEILVAGRGFLRIAYSCLGLGVSSFFAAFVIAYPKPIKIKVIFLLTGIAGIEILNVIRFVLLVLFWNGHKNQIIDHHTLFNAFIYIVIACVLYFWVKTDHQTNPNAAN